MKSALETLFHICLIGNFILAFAAVLPVFLLALQLRRGFYLFYLPPLRLLTDERGRQINKYLNVVFRVFLANVAFMFLLGLIIRLM
jgi:hypothetical protein